MGLKPRCSKAAAVSRRPRRRSHCQFATQQKTARLRRSAYREKGSSCGRPPRRLPALRRTRGQWSPDSDGLGGPGPKMSIPCIFQGIPGHGNGDLTVGPALGIVADPTETVVGQSRRAAAAGGNLFGRLAENLNSQFFRVPTNDLGQFLDRVKIEMLRASWNRSRSGADSRPVRVVAPISVNGLSDILIVPCVDAPRQASDRSENLPSPDREIPRRPWAIDEFRR